MKYNTCKQESDMTLCVLVACQLCIILQVVHVLHALLVLHVYKLHVASFLTSQAHVHQLLGHYRKVTKYVHDCSSELNRQHNFYTLHRAKSTSMCAASHSGLEGCILPDIVTVQVLHRAPALARPQHMLAHPHILACGAPWAIYHHLSCVPCLRSAIGQTPAEAG